MILEWIEYFRTPASRTAKKFGHLHEAISLRSRSRRQQAAWATHLSHCHQFVNDYLNQNSLRSICVLGSGPLADISTDLFAKRYQKIYLVDLVHNLEVRKKFSGDERVVLLEIDLSGALAKFEPGPYRKEKMEEGEGIKELELAANQVVLPTADLYISANLMSQLARPMISWMGLNQTHVGAQIARLKIETAVAAGHWQLLQKLRANGGRVLYWTDVEKKFYSAQNQLEHIEKSLGDFQLPKPSAAWDWQIAPLGEISRQYAMVMQVQAGVLD